MQMTIFAQHEPNFVALFIKIALKSQILHFQDSAKLFSNNMKIKRPKTIYHNKKQVLIVRLYVIVYIKNLDQILASLQRGDIIISEVKYHFSK